MTVVINIDRIISKLNDEITIDIMNLSENIDRNG